MKTIEDQNARVEQVVKTAETLTKLATASRSAIRQGAEPLRDAIESARHRLQMSSELVERFHKLTERALAERINQIRAEHKVGQVLEK